MEARGRRATPNIMNRNEPIYKVRTLRQSRSMAPQKMSSGPYFFVFMVSDILQN